MNKDDLKRIIPGDDLYTFGFAEKRLYVFFPEYALLMSQLDERCCAELLTPYSSSEIRELYITIIKHSPKKKMCLMVLHDAYVPRILSRDPWEFRHLLPIRTEHIR